MAFEDYAPLLTHAGLGLLQRGDPFQNLQRGLLIGAQQVQQTQAQKKQAEQMERRRKALMGIAEQLVPEAGKEGAPQELQAAMTLLEAGDSRGLDIMMQYRMAQQQQARAAGAQAFQAQQAAKGFERQQQLLGQRQEFQEGLQSQRQAFNQQQSVLERNFRRQQAAENRAFQREMQQGRFNQKIKEQLLKPPKPATEQEKKATLAGKSMLNSSSLINRLEDSGVDPTEFFNVANIPVLGKYLSSSDLQAYRSAGDAWVTNVLRLESGAAVTDVEAQRYLELFVPQINEDVSAIGRKRVLRAEKMVEVLESALQMSPEEALARGIPINRNDKRAQSALRKAYRELESARRYAGRFGGGGVRNQPFSEEEKRIILQGAR